MIAKVINGCYGNQWLLGNEWSIAKVINDCQGNEWSCAMVINGCLGNEWSVAKVMNDCYGNERLIR